MLAEDVDESRHKVRWLTENPDENIGNVPTWVKKCLLQGGDLRLDLMKMV